jgi:3',5'-cyclic AMP phosphodiesterase CpdA
MCCLIFSISLGVLITLGIIVLVFFVVISFNIRQNCECEKYIPVKDRTVGKYVPYLNSETGYWTFCADDDFIIMQLTDIHIANIEKSIEADKQAIAAIRTLVNRINPDLIIITGDISHFGTFEEQYEQAKVVADVLNEMKVYWTFTFGNHEVKAAEERKKLGDFYESYRPYCLFQKGNNERSVGNTLINIENSNDELVQSLVLIDSNSYRVEWDYDNIHPDEISWYEQSIFEMKEVYGGKHVNSLMFMHIPLGEFRTALNKYILATAKNTKKIQWLGGAVGETLCISKYPDDMFETIKRLNSTKAVFCGHDHVNYFGVRYEGVELVYGMSIDYWAYAGGRVNQRGARVITVHGDGSFEHQCSRLIEGEGKVQLSLSECTDGFF